MINQQPNEQIICYACGLPARTIDDSYWEKHEVFGQIGWTKFFERTTTCCKSDYYTIPGG